MVITHAQFYKPNILKTAQKNDTCMCHYRFCYYSAREEGICAYQKSILHTTRMGHKIMISGICMRAKQVLGPRDRS